MIKLILAEDHHIVRNGIKNILNKEKEINVIAEASNGQEVINFLSDGLEADIVITDVNMPELNGIELASRIAGPFPRVKVIILTMLDDKDYVIKAFKSGVKGYLLKNTSKEELIFAIGHIFIRNERYICSELANNMLDKLLNTLENKMPTCEADLTKRESEVLDLISQGYTNQEIAEKTFTSKRTVEGHRQSLIEKTGARNSASLIRIGIINHLINIDPK